MRDGRDRRSLAVSLAKSDIFTRAAVRDIGSIKHTLGGGDGGTHSGRTFALLSAEQPRRERKVSLCGDGAVA